MPVAAHITIAAWGEPTDYYPYGLPFAGSTNPTANRYKYGAKELATDLGLNAYDFEARMQCPALPMFAQIDPLAEKYYQMSPYAYCAGNPVNLIDPSGMIVHALDEVSMRNIILSLSIEEAEYVQFNDGVIDVELLNQYQGTSENFDALKALANSDVTYCFSTAESYTNFSNGEKKELKSTTDDGDVGVTLMPNAPNYPSPDERVHIITSSLLSEEDMVGNVAHEGYGHAYFYELRQQGVDVNPFHDWHTEMGDLYINESGAIGADFLVRDVNTELIKRCETVKKQAISNYRSRQ